MERDSQGKFSFVRMNAEEIRSAYEGGKSLDEIASALGCSRFTVARRLKELGVYMRRGRPLKKRGGKNPPSIERR